MSGIQYEQVAHAADSLVSRGEHPTIRRVREMLGKGSQTTLSRFLTRWKEGRSAQAPEQEISPELRRALAEEMCKREALARSGPEADLALLRQDQEELLSENEQLKESVRLLSEKAARESVLVAELDLLRAEGTKSREIIEGLQNSWVESEKEKAVLSERLKRLGGRRSSPPDPDPAS